jgi:hypothetical protein
MRDYDETYASFDWERPERYNFARDVIDARARRRHLRHTSMLQAPSPSFLVGTLPTVAHIFSVRWFGWCRLRRIQVAPLIGRPT